MLVVAVWIPLAAEAPAPLDRSPDNAQRFGVTQVRRRAFFNEIARNDARWRSIAAQSFPDDRWAQADHWSDHLSAHVRVMASRQHASLVSILLSFDEGLHKHWRGPGGKPLAATWPPLGEHRRR